MPKNQLKLKSSEFFNKPQKEYFELAAVVDVIAVGVANVVVVDDVVVTVVDAAAVAVVDVVAADSQCA